MRSLPFPFPLPRRMGVWACWIAACGVLLLAGLAAAQSAAPAFPVDLCPADRYGSDLGCTAKDVQITNISIHPGSSAPSSCVGGTSLTLDLDVTVDFGSSSRYDVGIFLSQDGASPQLQSTRTTAGATGSASCKVATLPSPPPPGTTATSTYPFPNLDAGPFTINGQTVYDTCGDGSTATVGGGTGTATFTITGVVVKCQALNSSGSLNIPFVVTWDNQASSGGKNGGAICTGPQNPVPAATSKCNAPSGTQGDVAVVTLPQITKTNPVSTLSPGDTTTYTITVTDTTGIALSNVLFKDPAVANLAVSNVGCAAQSATCPSSVTVAGMQGSGLTIPSMNNGGTVTFTLDAQVTGNPTGTLTNQATVSIGSASTAASASDTIVYPALVNAKTVTVTSDPVNGAANPKNIPGSESLYTISVTNTGQGRVDSNSVVISDPIPANTMLFVGNLGGSPAGPFSFSDAGSGLTFAYTSLAATSDDVDFSKDGGATWGYTPVPDASGYDAAVTNIRLNPKGRMNGWSGAGAYPGFNIGFKVKLK